MPWFLALFAAGRGAGEIFFQSLFTEDSLESQERQVSLALSLLAVALMLGSREPGNHIAGGPSPSAVALAAKAYAHAKV